MNERLENGGSGGSLTHGLLIGLIAGGAIGAAIALALAPRLRAELSQRVRTSAGDVSHAASQSYREASARVAGVVDSVTARGQAVRDEVADAVGRGAREVEQFAVAAKTVGPSRRA
jgi:gas vesicle protein